ncbi:hypothetical protein CBR_g16957 [Chara braunii]|uniref:Uncharacterized protein n=1 Tax=Chara braunii TaxID=69332 RepID=A0A388KU72_CHABU|nr:hypothetical protein CBR_g16957 [Chara braunii]|eukprot:GBG73614.1 hypothetical protein CBR_g16957 [Chara braunii]
MAMKEMEIVMLSTSVVYTRGVMLCGVEEKRRKSFTLAETDGGMMVVLMNPRLTSGIISERGDVDGDRESDHALDALMTRLIGMLTD